MAKSRKSVSPATENKHYVSRTVVPYEAKDEKKSLAPPPKVELVIEEKVLPRESKSLNYSTVFKVKLRMTEAETSVSKVILEKKEECSDLPDRERRYEWGGYATKWKYSIATFALSPDGSNLAFVLKREKEDLHTFPILGNKYISLNGSRQTEEHNELYVYQIKTQQLLKKLDLGVNSKIFSCFFDLDNLEKKSVETFNSIRFAPTVIKYFWNNPKKFVITNALEKKDLCHISFIEITSNGLSRHDQANLIYTHSCHADGTFDFPFRILESPLKESIAVTNPGYCSLYSQNSQGIHFVDCPVGASRLFAFIPGDLGVVFLPANGDLVITRNGKQEFLSAEPPLKDCFFDEDGNLVLVHADEKNATLIRLKCVDDLAAELAKPIVPRILARTLSMFSLDVNSVVAGYVGGDLRGLGLFSSSNGLRALEKPYSEEVRNLMLTANTIERTALAKYVDLGSAKEAFNEFANHLAPDSPVRAFLTKECNVALKPS